MKTETKKGGARKGSGRKPKDPTAVMNFRVPEDKIDFLKPLVADYIKSLLNPGEQTPATESIKPGTILIKLPPQKCGPKPNSEPTMAELLRQTYKH